MKEPYFCEARAGRTTELYRFLWLRTFHDPVLVRVEISPDGSGRLTLKVTNGSGGYEPGKIKTNKERKLKPHEIDNLKELLSNANFWNMPTEPPPDGMIGLDGARWITEGSRDGNCHVVDRWSPDGGIYKNLGTMFLIDLAGLKLLYQDVY